MTFSQHPPTDLFNKQHFFFSFSFIYFFLPNGQTAVRDVHLSVSCFCDPTESLRGFRIKKNNNKKNSTSFFFFQHGVSNTDGSAEPRLSPSLNFSLSCSSVPPQLQPSSTLQLSEAPTAVRRSQTREEKKNERPKWPRPGIHRRYDQTRTRDKTWINPVSVSGSADGRHNVSSLCLVQLRESEEPPEF